MFVTKRDGKVERVAFDKITARVAKLHYGLSDQFVDPVTIAQKVIQGIYPGVTTKELDELAAETTAYLSTKHPHHGILAARIVVSRLHKQTHDHKRFSQVAKLLHDGGIVSDHVYEFVQSHASELDGALVHGHDFYFDYFGFKTLERSYLLRLNDVVVERPQHMFMRVAVGIHCGNVKAAIETYELMSHKYFIHASPTLFAAGTIRPQLSSCFLMSMEDDSVEGIFDAYKHAGVISKGKGGIGLHIHGIRATNSKISTGGKSSGILPMLRVLNSAVQFIDQGGKRPAAAAPYLEPWHADIFDFIDIRKNIGDESRRARDLFPALWIPDLFMRRVEAEGDWSLFSPDEAPGLHEVWGDSFVDLYERYEREGRAREVVKAQKLWKAILEAQTETGTPFMLYKDACNAKSNQRHLGTIKSSNLCTEVVLYSSAEETAVCSLASLSLGMFVTADKHGKLRYDFEKLHSVTKVVTRNLNKVIDITSYPVKEARVSNMRHRPIGIGVQGLADAFFKLRLPFESEGAKKLNRDIFETIYHAALEASCELADKDGAYETFAGSPASEGLLQFDLWGVDVTNERYDWDALRKRVISGGLRNSVLISPMPTASTSQILGNNECFEPFTSNVYTRRVLSGEFQVVNRYLMEDLIRLNLWDDNVKNQLIAANGSVQGIDAIPPDLKELYKTVWEISQKTVIDMAADRGPFIDQSQSLNIHMASPSFAKLSSMHFYGWKKGLKTGMYYLRTRPAADASKATVDVSRLPATSRLAREELAPICSMDNECLSCSA